MKASIVSKFILLACVGQITACQHTVESTEINKSFDTSRVVFQIAADTVACTTISPIAVPMPRRCLVVNGKTFHDAIDGFDHQEGVGRTIKIARTQICDPDVYNSCLQDTVSIYSYRFLEIVE